MPEIVAAHLERVARELVDSWRKDSGKIVRWERLKADVAAALAACAREANERAAQCAESQRPGTGPVGVAFAIRALERAAGEKA